jgi:hypothetical protein
MASYGLLGETPEEPTERTKLLWIRGKLDEGWFIDHILAPRVGGENVTREKAVPWPVDQLPVGELHEDAFVSTEGMPYEIKSHADGSLMDSDYLQLKGALHYDQDVVAPAGKPKVGALVVIDRDLQWQAIPVYLTDDAIEEVEQRAADVIRAGKTGELPDRVCEKPGDARGHLCPFAEKCFAGWSPPDPVHLDGDIGLLAIELMHAQTAERAKRKEAAAIEEERKAIAERLAEWNLVPGLEYRGAGVRLKRTKVDDSEKVSLSQLKKAGAFTPELEVALRPFINASGGHDRWSVKPDADAGLTADDFGEEAPF